LIYLTQKYDGGAWYPDDADTRGEIQQWLSFSVYDIANSFLLARALVIFKREGDLDGVEALSRNALQVLENHLKTREWLASDHVTIADIACYPYTALLEEGRLSLDSYPAVRQWIARVEALPGYEAMPGLPFGEKG
jgi:glutathione S-transferase